MKCVILAGGLGTRISEESENKPKPMIEIGSKPIIWHIMKIYAAHNITDFIICLGYKGYLIKEYFSNYFLHMSDVTIDLKTNQYSFHRKNAEPWKITLVETGLDTMTGGRIKKIKKYVKDEDVFCLTYGDGLSDVNITKLIEFHFQMDKLCTLTAIQPPARFGVLEIDGSLVTSFNEKPMITDSRVNGGFFVLSPKVIDLIKDDTSIWEKKPLETLAQENELAAYQHNGFWQPMDTLRDQKYLQRLWEDKLAPWKSWE
jgi:glucose-1-phosphate cytidylyltransferase